MCGRFICAAVLLSMVLTSPPSPLHLEALEVRLVLHDLDERHGGGWVDKCSADRLELESSELDQRHPKEERAPVRAQISCGSAATGFFQGSQVPKMILSGFCSTGKK